MEVRNCKGCGRLFNYLSGPPLCPACVKALEDKFFQVKEYLRDYPDSALNRVADDNEVSVKQLKQWVREERLTFSEHSSVTIDCENCGAQIRSGRFCNNCKAILKSDISGAIARPKIQPAKSDKREKERMRFLDNQ
ncbi:flagellar protein [Lachnospiraceae bacterium ZAX-1]